MKKSIYLSLVLVLVGFYRLNAQSRVFKEVSDEISSKIVTINQDGALVGYLQFTELERANEDSFKYSISIIDENLNDIGKIDFKEEKLIFKGVSFEGDVLCLTYLKSNVIGKDAGKRKEFKQTKQSAKNSFFTQFLSLDGKIIKTNEIPVDIEVEKTYVATTDKEKIQGSFKRDIQIVNIPQKGFACFYGDNSNSNLVFFDTKGEIIWKKNVEIGKNDGVYLNNTDDAIYILRKANESSYSNELGGFSVLSFNAVTGQAGKEYELKDNNQHSLYVNSFEKDPSTGKLSIAGTILKKPYSYNKFTKDYTKGRYIGAFSILFDGFNQNKNKYDYFIWGDKSKLPEISKKGRFVEQESYFGFDHSFRDYNGNTYFVGNSVIKKLRIGCIISSVLLSPLVVTTIAILQTGGTRKYKIGDGMIYRLDEKSGLTFIGDIGLKNSSYGLTKSLPYNDINYHSYVHISSSVDKSDFILCDDREKVVIYSIQKKDIIKTIPHKTDKKIYLDIFTAKEGHILVVEYNSIEKTRTFSIEKI